MNDITGWWDTTNDNPHLTEAIHQLDTLDALHHVMPAAHVPDAAFPQHDDPLRRDYLDSIRNFLASMVNISTPEGTRMHLAVKNPAPITAERTQQWQGSTPDQLLDEWNTTRNRLDHNIADIGGVGLLAEIANDRSHTFDRLLDHIAKLTNALAETGQEFEDITEDPDYQLFFPSGPYYRDREFAYGLSQFEVHPENRPSNKASAPVDWGLDR